MKALYTILLLGLFFWGYRLCKKNLCPSDTTAAAVPAATASDCDSDIAFVDGDNLNIVSDENFNFDYSDNSFTLPSDDFLSKTIDVINYLTDNTDRIMRIKAYYLEEEENTTQEKTLGLARAKSIASFFRDQGVSQSQLQVMGKKTENACVLDSVLIRGCSIEFAGK